MTRIKSNDKSHDRGFYLEFDSYENRNKAYNTYLKRSSDTHHRKSGGCNIKLVGDVWVQACEMFLESNEKTTLSDFQTVKDTSLYLLYDYQKGIEEEKAEKSINSNEC
ncbi:MAG: hypothetical protein EP298_09860 [Gammaproteobacteria bacterium]|nr:MAG: hypothetical protein EP298_09860 [Gammaproteobacteria bacterium]UTW41551.1 hypothetical protein KFE69_08515 [bacterium SCSIO 12844]